MAQATKHHHKTNKPAHKHPVGLSGLLNKLKQAPPSQPASAQLSPQLPPMPPQSPSMGHPLIHHKLHGTPFGDQLATLLNGEN